MSIYPVTYKVINNTNDELNVCLFSQRHSDKPTVKAGATETHSMYPDTRVIGAWIYPSLDLYPNNTSPYSTAALMDRKDYVYTVTINPPGSPNAGIIVT